MPSYKSAARQFVDDTRMAIVPTFLGATVNEERSQHPEYNSPSHLVFLQCRQNVKAKLQQLERNVSVYSRLMTSDIQIAA